MLKRILAAIALGILAPAAAFAAGPYVQGLWTKNNPVYVTGGVTYTTDKLKADAAVTAVAVAYHPLSAGSLWDRPWAQERIPAWLNPLLPRESWACSVGGSWNSNTKAGVIGCGLNLLDTVRNWASKGLEASGNERMSALGAQIAPGNGPISLYVSRVEQLNSDGKFVPRWMFAGSYGF